MPPKGNTNHYAKNPIPAGDKSLTDTSKIDAEFEYPGVPSINQENCSASHGFHIAFRVKYVSTELLQNEKYIDQVCRRMLEFMIGNFPYAIYQRLTQLIIDRNRIFVERASNEKAIGDVTNLGIFSKCIGLETVTADSSSIGSEIVLASGQNRFDYE